MATILRTHFLRKCFALTESAMEEAVHAVQLCRKSVGPEGAMCRLPYVGRILRPGGLLEGYWPAAPMPPAVNRVLQERVLTLEAGTLGDATLIVAPSPAKTSHMMQTEALLHGEGEIESLVSAIQDALIRRWQKIAPRNRSFSDRSSVVTLPYCLQRTRRRMASEWS
ncbi:MAG: hypothetical protein LT103_13865 [Burkholderiaceae bacterium]|nr:hypothetical protein [Burkholderiaceae bacterium]